MRLVTPEQMRQLEEMADAEGTSYEQMMNRAGKNIYAVIRKQVEHIEKPHILFLCGNGNNGGDCFVAARYLAEHALHVTVALVCGVPKTIRAYAEYKRMGEVSVLNSYHDIKAAMLTTDIVVDGIYGTGFHGVLRSDVRQILELAAHRFCIAVDVPSGGDCETGAVAEGTLHCRMTISFGACKFGMVQYPLKSYCGDVLVADIGIQPALYDRLAYPSQVLTEDSLCAILPPRPVDSHKGDFGKLLCVTGSVRMPGACVMSAQAALRCGIGLLRIAVPERVIPIVAGHCCEPVFLPLTSDESGFVRAENADAILEAAEKSTALLIGCGIGVTDETRQLVQSLIRKAPCPIILDADGINCIADSIDIIKEAKAGLVLTPHAAELARLLHCTTDEVQQDRLHAAASLAKVQGAVVVLKGAGTIVATPDCAYVNATGNSGMSKGGSGDVLAGMLASFIAQGIPMERAASLSVYLHGKAGDCAASALSEHAMLPTDLLAELPKLFLQMESHA